MNGLEYRAFPASVSSVRADGSGGGMVASGYAVVYNSLSLDLGGFVETIAPGALTESLKNDVRALYAHDHAQLLGRTSSGTLQLRETDKGLAFALSLPDTTVGRDVAVLMGRGDLRAMSFGFNVVKGGDEWNETQDGGILRILKKINLHEVSIVGSPAYPATVVGL